MTPYILLFIVGSNIGSVQAPRYESLVSINQEYDTKQRCEEAMSLMLSHVAKKADILAAACTKKR